MLALTAPDESDSHGVIVLRGKVAPRRGRRSCESVSRGAVGHEAVDRDLRLVDIFGVIDVAERGQQRQGAPT
jgi:hypothetical protein